jgi:hypothetical protein
MKHIKLYEDFVNESKSSANPIAAEIEKNITDYTKLLYKMNKVRPRRDATPEQARLKYQEALLSHKGDKVGAEKVKDKIEKLKKAQSTEYEKIYDEIKKFENDFNKKYEKYTAIITANLARNAASELATYQAYLETDKELAKIYK